MHGLPIRTQITLLGLLSSFVLFFTFLLLFGYRLHEGKTFDLFIADAPVPRKIPIIISTQYILVEDVI